MIARIIKPIIGTLIPSVIILFPGGTNFLIKFFMTDVSLIKVANILKSLVIMVMISKTHICLLLIWVNKL